KGWRGRTDRDATATNRLSWPRLCRNATAAIRRVLCGTKSFAAVAEGFGLFGRNGSVGQQLIDVTGSFVETGDKFGIEGGFPPPVCGQQKIAVEICEA